MERAAVIVVDVQNDFVHPTGKVGEEIDGDVSGLLKAVAEINRLIVAARAASAPVVYVRVTHSPTVDAPSYRARYEVRGMSADDLLCADGSWGAEFYKGLLEPRPEDLVVTKHGYDAFAQDSLTDRLHELGVDTVIVTGVVTELCVMGTVSGGFERGFHVLVPRETTASIDNAAAEAALSLIAGFYGTVVSVDDCIRSL
ncbi:MAG: cysteine hydrolase [Actinobacteria bacterium]|nr:cysteine hydrolase [Actinomycetota bacterium]